MTTHRIETRLDEATVKELDGWRSTRIPEPSRSEAVRLLLEERLCGGRRARERRPAGGRRPEAARLGALYALERVSGFGPVKFRALHEAGIDSAAALKQPDLLPFKGRIGDKLRRGVEALSLTELDAARARADDQVERAHALGASILTHGDPGYPERVYASNNPVPVLYVRGDPAVWDDAPAVAVVGSRNTREPYTSAARTFAAVAARDGVLVVSGFAIGADSIGHTASLEAGGGTVCVMPCGLDNVFPPESRELWEQLLANPRAVFVSEFGFGQRASSLLLRKRNKLIVAFVQGVLVAQSALDGGAMNAYRFGREQRKPVATFRNDGSKDTTGNAAIENDARTGRFGLEARCRESEYRAWLRTLSSWT
ncbi:MAG: DNA-processing protein DprA [Gammaproteobacteria bacterium]|nr:DNA-processing protein DprA [Gammaproteobacteria bacterium]